MKNEDFSRDDKNILDSGLVNVQPVVKSKALQNRVRVTKYLLNKKIYESNPIKANDLARKIRIPMYELGYALDSTVQLSPTATGAVGVNEKRASGGLLLEYTVFVQDVKKAKDYLSHMKKFL